jgi:predicted TIM-barrel fold metal-dependent hydrolase
MNRRHWLHTTAAATAGTLIAAPPPGVTPARPATRVIDTHTHFYDPTRPQGVPWPGKGTKLYRKVMPSDWQAVANPLDIKETVVVEASQWVEDNQWVLDVASHEKCIIGVVGNLDPNDAQFEPNLKRFAKNPHFRGIRWRGDLVRIEEHKDKVLAAAKLMADNSLSLDLNGPADMLPHAAKLAADVPALRIVINHLGASGDPQALNPAWKDNIRQIAAQKNVFMKVSALVEQVKCDEGKAPDDVDYYRPILDHLWQCFGSERLVYGSNWPVSDRGAPYATVFKIVRDYFAAKGVDASEKYFWKNAVVAYRLTSRE